MTYIIIDTNAWIYLCNAYGLQKSAQEANPHIKMFQALKNMVLRKEITILSNDIIFAEWERNKESSRSLIKKLQGQHKERSNRLKAKEVLKNPDEAAIIRNEIQHLESLIQKNEQHIADVEDLLLHHTVSYEITDRSKIIGANQAIDKKAPFTGKKSNSMADMVILLSGMEFISNYGVVYEDKNIGIKVYADSYFVSANKADFSSKQDDAAVHEDIKPYLLETSTIYYNNLGALINYLSDRPILDQFDLMDYDAYSSDFYPCPFCPDEHLGLIHYACPIKIRDEKYPLYDPKQIRFNFDNTPLAELNRNAYVEIQEGRCGGCGSYFIKCALCGESIPVYFQNDVEEYICKACLAVYRLKVKFGRKGDFESVNYTLLAKDREEDN